ncbi:MAG: hypothetical protein P8J37_01060 [Fuerstiella sp.]|nr:hypothetical protein [Fuerstiella sp.]
MGTSWHLLFETDWLRQAPFELGLSKGYFVTAFGLILLMEWIQGVSTTEQSERVYRFWSQSPSLRWTSYVALLLAVLNLGASKAQPFIYFQF